MDAQHWITDYHRRQRVKQARRAALEVLGCFVLGAGTVIVWYLAYLAA